MRGRKKGVLFPEGYAKCRDKKNKVQEKSKEEALNELRAEDALNKIDEEAVKKAELEMTSEKNNGI